MVLVAAITLLALFSFVSIVMSAEDPARTRDPKDNPLLWGALGRR